MSDSLEFNVPILTVHNQNEGKPLEITIEPHLDFYELPPGASCELFYLWATDNTVPEKHLDVAYTEDGLTIYSPGPYAPEVRIDGKPLKSL